MINLIDPINQSTASAATPAKKTLGQQDFLQLLITQMQNQDPLSPMDSTNFTAQLAQFGALQAMTDVKTSVDNLRTQQQTSTAAAVVSFVGKNVKAVGDALALGEADGVDGHFKLGGPATVTVKILDGNGNTVRTLDEGMMAAGDQTVTWDGLTDAGTRAAAGTYHLSVSATGTDGQAADVTTYSVGKVTGVDWSNGQTQFIVGEGTGQHELALSDLLEVSNETAQ